MNVSIYKDYYRTFLFLGVADGVGGWRTYGVDPSIFPNCLMETCGRLVEEGRFQPNHLIDMLSASYQEVLENKMPQIGEIFICKYWN